MYFLNRHRPPKKKSALPGMLACSQRDFANMTVSIICKTVLIFIISIKTEALQLPSIFQPDPTVTYKSKVCFNIGSKDEKIGPYSPESDAVAFPVGGVRVQEFFRIRKNFEHRRAFQTVRWHARELFFTVQVDPWYRYNVELGFIDIGSLCKKGGSSMNISASDELTKYNINPTAKVGCSVPYVEKFFRINPDAWNRLNISVKGKPTSKFATACIEKDIPSMRQVKGTLFADSDGGPAEVFLNGMSVLNTSDCTSYAQVKLTIRYGDVISAKCGGSWRSGGFRVAFFQEYKNRELFGTDDYGWKTRVAYPHKEYPPPWTSPDYVDRDWRDAIIVPLRCYNESFKSAAKRIWLHDGPVDGKDLIFRHRVMQY